MTAQGSRRIIVAIALSLAALALAAWWAWPRDAAAGVVAAMPKLSSVDAASTRAHASALDDGSQFSKGDAVGHSAAASAKDRVACMPERRARLREIRAALDPARSAQDAFSHALLGETLALIAPRDEDAARRETTRLEAEWQAARRRWPGDLDIAWQAANKCMAKFGCDEVDALDHLLELDPDNAAAWWLAMRKAWGRGDVAAYDYALARAAASRGSDARTGSVFLAVQPLLARAPQEEACVRADDADELQEALGHAPTSADWASVEAWSFELSGNSIVSYSAFAGCRERETGPLSQRRRADCIASLAVLASGDTMIEQWVALPLLIQLTGDTPDGLGYRERYRQLLYLSMAAPPTLMAGNPTDMLSAGEVETMRRAAIAAHRWPPPADWLPIAERQRMLITRGRLP